MGFGRDRELHRSGQPVGLAAVKASTTLLCMSKDTDRRWRDTGGSWGKEGNMGAGSVSYLLDRGMNLSSALTW